MIAPISEAAKAPTTTPDRRRTRVSSTLPVTNASR